MSSTNDFLDAITSIGTIKSRDFILQKEKDSLEIMVKDLTDRLNSARRQIKELQELQKENYELATDSIINISKMRTISLAQVNTIIASLSSQKTAQKITQKLLATTTPDDWKEALTYIKEVGREIKGLEYDLNPTITGTDEEQKIREGEAIKAKIREGPQEAAIALVEKYSYFFMAAKSTYEQTYNEVVNINVT